MKFLSLIVVGPVLASRFWGLSSPKESTEPAVGAATPEAPTLSPPQSSSWLRFWPFSSGTPDQVSPAAIPDENKETIDRIQYKEDDLYPPDSMPLASGLPQSHEQRNQEGLAGTNGESLDSFFSGRVSGTWRWNLADDVEEPRSPRHQEQSGSLSDYFDNLIIRSSSTSSEDPFNLKI